MIYVLSTPLTQILSITLPSHNPIHNECSPTFYPGCWEHLKKKCTIRLIGAPTNTECLTMTANTPTVLATLALSCSLQWLFQTVFSLLRPLTFPVPTEFQQMTSPSSSQRKDKLSQKTFPLSVTYCDHPLVPKHICHILAMEVPSICTQVTVSSWHLQGLLSPNNFFCIFSFPRPPIGFL